MDRIEQAVGAVIFRKDGYVLLIQRGRPPMRGAWSLPGGHIQEGEAPSDAVEREVREETRLHVTAATLVEVVRIQREGHSYVIHEYLCTLVDEAQEAHAGDDASAVRWTPLEGMDELGVSVEAQRVVRRAAMMQPGPPGRC